MNERGLLAADVRTRAAPDLDREAAADVQHVVAEQPDFVRDRDGGEEASARFGVLVAHVHVPVLGPDGPACDRHRLDEPERVVLEQDAVLERSGLRLVGVGDDVLRAARGGDRVPLAAGGERGTASADETGVVDRSARRGRTDLRRARERTRAAARDEVVEVDLGPRSRGASQEAERFGRLVHGRRCRSVAQRDRAVGLHRRRCELTTAEARRGHHRGIGAVGCHGAARGAHDVDADSAQPRRPGHERERAVERRHAEGLGPPQAEAGGDLAECRRREPPLGVVRGVQCRQEQVPAGPGHRRAPVGRGTEYPVEGVAHGVGDRGRGHRR